jgi:hypothetical protein
VTHAQQQRPAARSSGGRRECRAGGLGICLAGDPCPSLSTTSPTLRAAAPTPGHPWPPGPRHCSSNLQARVCLPGPSLTGAPSSAVRLGRMGAMGWGRHGAYQHLASSRLCASSLHVLGAPVVQVCVRPLPPPSPWCPPAPGVGLRGCCMAVRAPPPAAPSSFLAAAAAPSGEQLCLCVLSYVCVCRQPLLVPPPPGSPCVLLAWLPDQMRHSKDVVWSTTRRSQCSLPFRPFPVATHPSCA